MVRFLNEIDYRLNKCFNPKLNFTFMYDNLKNYATKALIVSALLGGNSVMMPAFAAGEHGMAAPASDGRVKGTVTDAKGESLTGPQGHQ